jgi:hypothetical protein
MSEEDLERPFESIESAHEYMSLLASTTLETITELRHDHAVALAEGADRRAQAIEIAVLKLKQLGCHVHKSRLMLNDLRILRRLILNERLSVESARASS